MKKVGIAIFDMDDTLVDKETVFVEAQEAMLQTLARPVIGAVAALAIFAFLVAGLLQVNGVTPGIVLAISFAAGFSERLVMSAVEKVT